MSTTDQADTGGPRRDEVDHDTVPPARKGLLAVAGVLLLIPIVALMWVGSYSRVEPQARGRSRSSSGTSSSGCSSARR